MVDLMQKAAIHFVSVRSVTSVELQNSCVFSVRQSEPVDDTFPSEIHFPLSLPLTSDLAEEEEEELEEPGRSLPDIQGHMVVVSCDHNYTAEAHSGDTAEAHSGVAMEVDSVRQKKRIEHLEHQLRILRKKMKTMQQKCRRQDRRIKRLKAAGRMMRTNREPAAVLGEEYVILPKHIYHALKGIK